jgi:hypothetical protein
MKSKAVIAKRRELKIELVTELAEVAIRCKNGGRTLRGDEAADITDTVSKLYIRARDEDAALKSVMMSAKGCKGAPDAVVTQGIKNLYELLASVATGGCGEAFTQDCGLYAKHIVDSNPDNEALTKLWRDNNYTQRLQQAKTDGENELADYLKRPAQRAPTNWDEALAYLAYFSADTDEAGWRDGIVEAVKDEFNTSAQKDSYLRGMYQLWNTNIDKFTFKKALTMCIKDYPDQAGKAKVRLAALK